VSRCMKISKSEASRTDSTMSSGEAGCKCEAVGFPASPQAVTLTTVPFSAVPRPVNGRPFLT
jgi:hypothetical protein